METEEVIVSCRVPAQWAKWLDELAEISDGTRSNVMRQAIEMYVVSRKYQLTIPAHDDRQGEM